MSLAIFASNRKANRSESPDTEESPAAYNPYLAARREWDERYGDQIARARNWRAMAFLCVFVAVIAASGVVWLATRSRVVPFVVVTDNLGLARGLRHCRSGQPCRRAVETLHGNRMG